MKKLLLITTFALGLAACTTYMPESQSRAVLTTDKGQDIGRVIFTDTDQGLKVIVKVDDLPMGEYGFHVFAASNCSGFNKDGEPEPYGHFDPESTDKHLGPDGGGHQGDLPRLVVNNTHRVKEVFYLQGITAQSFKNHAIMIHEGGDNYKGSPDPMGGDGARVACGVIK